LDYAAVLKVEITAGGLAVLTGFAVQGTNGYFIALRLDSTTLEPDPAFLGNATAVSGERFFQYSASSTGGFLNSAVDRAFCVECVVGAYKYGGSDGTIRVLRIVADGTGLDHSFGSSGTSDIVVPGYMSSSSGGLDVDSSGRAVLVTSSSINGGRPEHILTFRLTPSGNPDISYGTNGRTEYLISSPDVYRCYAADAKLDAIERIVAVVYCEPRLGSTIGYIRFTTNGAFEYFNLPPTPRIQDPYHFGVGFDMGADGNYYGTGCSYYSASDTYYFLLQRVIP
jgi:hypothetical protein